MLNGTTLDTSTQALLMTLSAAVQSAKSSGAPDAEIETLAVSVKQKIDSQLVNLRGSSAELAQKISEIIANKEWAQLPAPSDMEMTLARINEVATALSHVVDNVMTDIGEIFRVLMELNRKIMLDNRGAQVRSNQVSVAESKEAIKDREYAAYAQFGSEIASSVAQFAMASLSLRGAAKSLGKTKDAVKASKDAFEMTVGKDGDKSGSLIKLKEKSEKTGQQVKAIEHRLESLPKNDPRRPALEKDYTDALSLHEQAKTEFEFINQQVEQKQSHSMNQRLLADANMQIHKARGEMVGAAINALSASGKFTASFLNLKAEQKDINKSQAEKSYQAGQEVVTSVRESLRGLLNSLQALEQVLSNMNSVLARNTA